MFSVDESRADCIAAIQASRKRGACPRELMDCIKAKALLPLLTLL